MQIKYRKFGSKYIDDFKSLYEREPTVGLGAGMNKNSRFTCEYCGGSILRDVDYSWCSICAREPISQLPPMHDSHLMYQAGQEMCRNCGAIRNWREWDNVSHEMISKWFFNNLEVPDCLEAPE